MNDHVPFQLSASFVLERAIPTGAELAYGYRNGWLRPADVVGIALAKLRRGVAMWAAEEELALLLADDLTRVDVLISDLQIADQPNEARARLWLFLALAWLWEHRTYFDDVLDVIERLYAEFDYPEEISNLVRYMPAPPATPTKRGKIDQRWRAYLERTAAEYHERDAPSEAT